MQSDIERNFGLTGRAGVRVWLKPLDHDDNEFLYQLTVTSVSAVHWRYRGVVVCPEQFAHELWTDVLAQFIVVVKDTNERVGLVSAYGPNPRNGYVYIGAVMSPDARFKGLGIEGLHLLVAAVFELWSFRKLYFEVPEFTFSQFGSAVGPLMQEEGCLRSHVYIGGRYWDQRILALYREDFYQAQEWLSGAPAVRGGEGDA